MSVTAGPAPPLYGTWTMSSPASERNNSISRRFRLPLPGDAKLIWVAFFFACSTSSVTVLAGKLLAVTSTSGTFDTSDTGTKALAVKRCLAPKIVGLIASVPTLPRNTV